MTSKFDEFLNTEIEGTTAPDVQVIQLTREDLDLIITKAVNKKFTHLKINLMDTINFHMNAYISDNKNFGNRTRADILIEIGLIIRDTINDTLQEDESTAIKTNYDTLRKIYNKMIDKKSKI